MNRREKNKKKKKTIREKFSTLSFPHSIHTGNSRIIEDRTVKTEYKPAGYSSEALNAKSHDFKTRKDAGLISKSSTLRSNAMRIKIKTKQGTEVPEYAHEGDAAFDLRASDSEYITAGEWKLIGTGIKVEIPEGYAGLLLPRSGISNKQGLSINGPSLIDSGYRGEIMAPVHNINRTAGREIRKGERIAQLMIVPFVHAEFEQVSDLSDSDRGQGGFGSTGVK